MAKLLPMLASDVAEHQIRFPCDIQPKIDGVRGINLAGVLTGRSLNPHANVYTTDRLSRPRFRGLDGELISGHWTDQALCRTTTSALNTIKGEPDVKWYVFDFLRETTLDLPYKERYGRLQDYISTLHDKSLIVVPSFTCKKLDDLLQMEDEWLNLGFEGLIIRGNVKHKSGRSTVREGGLLRLKRFIEEEAVVESIEEGQENHNAAKTNELGLTERSSHQENMVPNGMVGSLICTLCKDIHDPQSKNLLFTKGQRVTVSAGSLPHNMRRLYFDKPGMILKQTIKFKTFLKGAKDKPRFPTFVSIRAKSDIS